MERALILDGLNNVTPATNRFINLEWSRGIAYSEGSSVDESNNAVAMISAGKSIEELNAENFNAANERTQTGMIDFVATRSKYFAVALVPTATFDGTAYMRGTKFGAPDAGLVEEYAMGYRLPYRGGRTEHTFTLYAGPMQYDTLHTYGLTEIMNFGLKWIVKPIGKYFMLPTLKIIQSLTGNYGVAIIIFSILIKLLLYPLSITQMKSAQKMQLLAPLMADIREKYKDDQMTQNQEMMKLYGQYGINPAGGCLPLLLQMPFLYALYSVLNLNIELRQAAFLPVWLTDLSVPDVILALPFKLPLFNIDKFSGLALLMGATLFIQQKQMVSDPRQKAMIYMMPVMLTLMFSALPSGLNLYYFMFNVMGIGQQLYMTKWSKNRLTLEQLKSMPRKEGWLQRKMREAQELAAAQGRSIPGQPSAPSQQQKPSSKRPKGR
ncbi:MAG: membrane protein insertase YidC [Candidatus Kapabacteria bacterium]|nr:membrane protein insertase YidC [Candidatus Kapabacteria bacterium]